MGNNRTTFVIGADGRIEKVFAKVKADAHLAQVLEVL
jgi:peroxiredoxin Q/BCP